MSIERLITNRVKTSLAAFPAVYVNGPRQAGKSTLSKAIAQTVSGSHYISLDNVTARAAAETNPQAFIAQQNSLLVIDEVQLAPELFRALKISIDQQREANQGQLYGRYLLTGSANIMALPKLSDALVGRMGLATLWPFSLGEVSGSKAHDFVSSLYHDTFSGNMHASFADFQRLSLKATYPEIALNQEIDRSIWFEGYLTTLLQRDVRELMQIEKIAQLPNLLLGVASRIASLFNRAEVARLLGMNDMTFARYFQLVENIFLIKTVPAWHANLGKRLVRSPKVYFADTQLLCHLLKQSFVELMQSDPNLYGKVLENLVASELMKQLSFNNIGKLYHFRTQDKKEVDFIIEFDDGKVAAIEVKAKEKVVSQDFSVIKMLQEKLGDKFCYGVVLYQGDDFVPFGERLAAVPVAVLI